MREERRGTEEVVESSPGKLKGRWAASSNEKSDFCISSALQ
jgi:hypothetical protein